MKQINTRFSLGISAFLLALGVTASAFADAPNTRENGRPQCSGEHGGNRSEGDRAQHAADRFKKADKNSDGFLTQVEVGNERWSRIQVADANKDGKVSQAELAQARADGKLGHGKHGKRPA